jgi:hypothetical protein
MKPVTSEAIRAIGYDPASKTARIEFSNGRIHDYPGTEPGDHDALVAADSIGRHFNAHIRGRNHVRVA